MTSKNFEANADRRDRLERYDDIPDSRLGMNFMRITLKLAYLFLILNDFAIKVAVVEPNETMDGSLIDTLPEAELSLRRRCRRKQFCAPKLRVRKRLVSTRNLDTGLKHWISRTRKTTDLASINTNDNYIGRLIILKQDGERFDDAKYVKESYVQKFSRE